MDYSYYNIDYGYGNNVTSYYAFIYFTFSSLFSYSSVSSFSSTFYIILSKSKLSKFVSVEPESNEFSCSILLLSLP